MKNDNDFITRQFHKYVTKAQHHATLSARSMALRCLNEIDPDNKTPSLLTTDLLNGLTQHARLVLRKTYGQTKEENQPEQMYMFEKLQARYSVRREGDDVYVSLEDIETREGRRLANRFRKVAGEHHKHGDALDAYFDERERKATEGKNKKLA